MRSEEQEREAFEAWRRRTAKTANPDTAVALNGFGDDAQYDVPATRAMWTAWQARASLLPHSEGEGGAEPVQRWRFSVDAEGDGGLDHHPQGEWVKFADLPARHAAVSLEQASAEYFGKRPQIDTMDRRNVFKAGFEANAAPHALGSALTEIVRELRWYNPAADAYKGKYIHKGWADRIEAALAAAPAPADDWQQYAQEGENAQQCIERHRGEQGALMRLLGKARETDKQRFDRMQAEYMENVGTPSQDLTPGGSGEAWKLVPVEPTQEMVSAYLKANDAYWKRTDELPSKNASRWREGKPNEATAESYRAMLAAAPSADVPAVAVQAEPVAWVLMLRGKISGKLSFTKDLLGPDSLYEWAPLYAHPKPAAPATADDARLILKVAATLERAGERPARAIFLAEESVRALRSGASAQPASFDTWRENHEFEYQYGEPRPFTEKHLREAFGAGAAQPARGAAA